MDAKRIQEIYAAPLPALFMIFVAKK